MKDLHFECSAIVTAIVMTESLVTFFAYIFCNMELEPYQLCKVYKTLKRMQILSGSRKIQDPDLRVIIRFIMLHT